jgi:hypothetical protein
LVDTEGEGEKEGKIILTFKKRKRVVEVGHVKK